MYSCTHNTYWDFPLSCNFDPCSPCIFFIEYPVIYMTFYLSSFCFVFQLHTEIKKNKCNTDALQLRELNCFTIGFWMFSFGSDEDRKILTSCTHVLFISLSHFLVFFYQEGEIFVHWMGDFELHRGGWLCVCVLEKDWLIEL